LRASSKDPQEVRVKEREDKLIRPETDPEAEGA